MTLQHFQKLDPFIQEFYAGLKQDYRKLNRLKLDSPEYRELNDEIRSFRAVVEARSFVRLDHDAQIARLEAWANKRMVKSE